MAAGVGLSVSCTGGTERGQAEPGAEAGSEAVQRTAPSGCGMESPAAEAWVSAGARVPGSGLGMMAAAWGAAWWG